MSTNGIIIFDGPDGVGKTTLINYIKKKYKRRTDKIKRT